MQGAVDVPHMRILAASTFIMPFAMLGLLIGLAAFFGLEIPPSKAILDRIPPDRENR